MSASPGAFGTLDRVELGSRAWLHDTLTRIRAGLDSEDDEGGEVSPAEPRVVTFDELVEPGSTWLRGEFDRLCHADVPPKAAATYLVGWYAGSLAEAIGVGLAGGAAFIPDASSVRWTVHPLGWVVDFDGDYRVVVASGSPWEREPDVEVAAPSDIPNHAAQGAITVCRPIVDACRTLTRVAAVGLWNQVVDALGMVLAYQSVLPPSAEQQHRLRQAVRSPRSPWRSCPELDVVVTDDLGEIDLARKGGCCLAYTEPEHTDLPLNERYCSTCPHLELEVCWTRQLDWHRTHRPAPT